MKKFTQIILVCGLVLTFGACSSSPTDEMASGEAADPAMSADAATDAVPLPTAEGEAMAEALPPADAAAPMDGEMPPADPNALAQTDTPPAPIDPAPVEPAPTEPTQASIDPMPAADPMAVTPSPAGDGTYESYTVQSGDTLMKIAFETYGDLYRWRGIYEANRDKVSDPNHIPPGTVLQVEKPSVAVMIEKNGERYLIKEGDTLGTISNDVYGTTSKWRKLWENNKQLIRDPNKIFAGFYLYYQPEANMHQPSMANSPDGNERNPSSDTASAAGAVPQDQQTATQ